MTAGGTTGACIPPPIAADTPLDISFGSLCFLLSVANSSNVGAGILPSKGFLFFFTSQSPMSLQRPPSSLASSTLGNEMFVLGSLMGVVACSVVCFDIGFTGDGCGRDAYPGKSVSRPLGEDGGKETIGSVCLDGLKSTGPAVTRREELA